jgi:hypothetical protein
LSEGSHKGCTNAGHDHGSSFRVGRPGFVLSYRLTCLSLFHLHHFPTPQGRPFVCFLVQRVWGRIWRDRRPFFFGREPEKNSRFPSSGLQKIWMCFYIRKIEGTTSPYEHSGLMYIYYQLIRLIRTLREF